ncbi:MAG: hypothetical protein O7D91_06105 [Planctomycetota bacterium]|nr:hypothetical protein [Planctomycetota bacterium]
MSDLVSSISSRVERCSLIGRPEILWDEDGPDRETGGTKRYWELHVDRWQETDDAHQLQWSFLDYSPYNPGES